MEILIEPLSLRFTEFRPYIHHILRLFELGRVRVQLRRDLVPGHNGLSLVTEPLPLHSGHVEHVSGGQGLIQKAECLLWYPPAPHILHHLLGHGQGGRADLLQAHVLHVEEAG